jgi:putative tryptophan/tyrosine transport system substrate-binding protein
MRRRDVVALLSVASLAGSSHAWAEQLSAKVWRIGYLLTEFRESQVQRALYETFRDELRRLGYVDGKNLVIEFRTAGGRAERLDLLATELVASKPDVLVAVSTPAIAAAHRATQTIPIVMWGVGDAVALGFIKSLAQPGGNLTGVATMSSETVGKSLEILHSIVPEAKRVAVLGASNPTHKHQFEEAAAAGKVLGFMTLPIIALTRNDLEAAFTKMADERCDGLLVLAAPIEPRIVAFAAANKMPAVYQFSAFVELGGLASYGASLAQMGKQAAQYADKIFRGAKPATLPVEQPVVFEIALNLKTAAALGLTIPPEVIARADKVIE